MPKSTVLRGLAAGAALVTGIAVAVPAGAAGTLLGWSAVTVQSPSGLTHDFVATGNMACTGPGSCVVAGYAEDEASDPATYEPLVWELAGSSWKLAKTGVKGSGALDGTVCPGTDECWSVGATFSGPKGATSTGLVERFDGRHWSPVSLPDAGGVSLNGVSCASAADCMTVGNRQTSADAAHAVGYRWNGTGWAPMAMPSPTGAIWTVLDAVYCDSATLCVALGDFQKVKDGTGYFFSEGWNGKDWVVETMPQPGKFDLGNQTGLYTTSCLDDGACLAIGDALSYTGGQMGASFPGGVAYDYRPHGAWSVVPKPAPGNGWVLNDDSCDGASCWVPLEAGPPQNPYVTLTVARWSGGGFSEYRVGVTGYLDAVSCSAHGTTTRCLGLGEGGSSTAPRMIAGEFSVP